MTAYMTPGVYAQNLVAATGAALRTGVPVFLGLASNGPIAQPRALTSAAEFGPLFGVERPGSYLATSARLFFSNGGRLCYVLRLADDTRAALDAGLAAIGALEGVDLVCAPDIMRAVLPLERAALGSNSIWSGYAQQPGSDSFGPTEPLRALALQQAVLDHCTGQGDRFAILDALPASKLASANYVFQQRAGLNAANGALYYPWVLVATQDGATRLVPPCGAIAGVYARTDQRDGVHRTPANQPLLEVLDTEVVLTTPELDQLNTQQINGLRPRPNQGITVWGARTLSVDPAWRYVNVRRLFLTLGRWLNATLTAIAFEPNDSRLWARIEREISAYCTTLFERGALQGRTAQEAFFVRCDAATNPAEVRDAGQVVTVIGLAPVAPSEFVVVRIIQRPTGATIEGPVESVS